MHRTHRCSVRIASVCPFIGTAHLPLRFSAYSLESGNYCITMYNIKIIIADNLGSPPDIKMKCILFLCMFRCFSFFGFCFPGIRLICPSGLCQVLRGVVFSCRSLVVDPGLTIGTPCPAEFRVPLVVEERDVAQNLELFHHVSPMSVEFVDVLDQLGDGLGHGCQFGTGELVGHVHGDAGYHSEASRSVSASCFQRSRAAAALS